MVEQLDADHRSGLRQPTGHRDVGPGGSRISGGMVVGNDDPSSFCANRCAVDLTGIDDRVSIASCGQDPERQQSVAVAEVEGGE